MSEGVDSRWVKLGGGPMAKIVDSSLKAFKIREREIAGGADRATRSSGRVT